MEIFPETADMLLDTAIDAAEQGRLAHDAYVTDMITIVLTAMVIVANIAAIILLLILHHQTKKPKIVNERYKKYKTTIGSVVNVEKVEYHIKRYVKKEGDEPSEKKPESPPTEIKKIRYKVFYEFTVPDSGIVYSGEFYIYQPGEVNPGDIIEITYKPDDPMINFTDYSVPGEKNNE